MTEHRHDPAPADTPAGGRDAPGPQGLSADNVTAGDTAGPDADPAAGAAASAMTPALVGEVVVRDAAMATPTQPGWSRRIAVARDRCVQLSANPAVVTAVTVGAGLAAGILRQALANGSRGPAGRGRTVTVSGVVVHRIDVIHHHVVHHVAGPPILPPAGPSSR